MKRRVVSPLVHCCGPLGDPAPAPPCVLNSRGPNSRALCLIREGEGGRGGRPSGTQAVAAALGPAGRGEAPAAEENPDQ